jgi:hypothetical protein
MEKMDGHGRPLFFVPFLLVRNASGLVLDRDGRGDRSLLQLQHQAQPLCHLQHSGLLEWDGSGLSNECMTVGIRLIRGHRLHRRRSGATLATT